MAGAIPTRDQRSGIVLLLVSGVVGILLILAMTLLQMSRTWARGAGAKAAAVRGRLAAASGMDYAAARLSRERTYPRFSATPLDRGDDWEERQGSGVAGSENPSYSHGESWVDDGDGRYEPGEPHRESDGDGRFSSWSGRFRGSGLRFSLRIESVGGKIPVNAGGAPTTDYAKGVAHVLNNLGAILFPDDGTRAWRKNAQCGIPLGAGEPIQCSRLGEDLFSARPPKGYASIEQVDAALAVRGYAAADRERILPFLDVGPYASKPDGGRSTYPYVPIEMATAPLEVLKAVWMYVGNQILFCPGSTAVFNNDYKRSGTGNLRFWQTNPSGGNPHGDGMTPMIFPDEAGALAVEADDLRRSGSYSWIALRERILQKAPAIFAKDVADLGAAFVDATTPLAQAGWTRGKADIAYFAAALLPPLYPPTPQAMNYLPVPSDSRPLALLNRSSTWSFFCRVRYPNFTTGSWAPFNDNAPFQMSYSNPIEPEGLTLGPPCWFRTASQGSGPGGASATVSALLRAAERLELSSQEDFENLSGGAILEKAWGLQAFDPSPSAKRVVLLDPDSGRTYPQVASIPVFNPSRAASPAFPRYAGGLVLAGRECGALGSGQYWPFSEDLDGNPANDGYSVASGVSYQLKVDGIPHAPSGAAWQLFQSPGLDGPTVWGVGPYLEAFSMEAWRMPGLVQKPPLGTGDGLWMNTLGGEGAWCFRSYRDMQGGRWGHLFEFIGGSWLSAFGLSPPKPSKLILDDDGAGNVCSGFHHFAMTFKRHLVTAPNGYRTTVRCYVDGTELIPGGQEIPSPPNYASMCMTSSMEYFFWQHFSDEIRLYNQELSESEVSAHYDMGRFVPPWTGPSADPRVTPQNPTYRSPRYVLGGGKVSWVSWTGWSPPALSGKVQVRVRLYGFDAAGSVIWEEELPAAGPWSPLPPHPPTQSFQYVVEFYSPTGAPNPPLLDTPLFGPISFLIQRPGASPAWTTWESR